MQSSIQTHTHIRKDTLNTRWEYNPKLDLSLIKINLANVNFPKSNRSNRIRLKFFFFLSLLCCCHLVFILYSISHSMPQWATFFAFNFIYCLSFIPCLYMNHSEKVAHTTITKKNNNRKMNEQVKLKFNSKNELNFIALF